MGIETILGIAAPIVSGMMGSDAAESASNAQVESTREANKLQREMFDKQVALQEPFRQGGLAAQNKLMTLLGLSPRRSAGGTPSSRMGPSGPRPMLQPAVNALDPAAMRAQLLPQFTKPGGQMVYDPAVGDMVNPPQMIDEEGLQAAMQSQQQPQGQEVDQLQDGMGDPDDPEYGSLMKDFAEVDPTLSMRDFSMADFEQDPGYKFRMEQGQEALERGAAARGGLYSGAAGKALMDYGQGMGAQEYGAAFNRFQVNRGNKVSDYTNRFNRFQTNRTNKLNPLQSIMGAGQSSANQIGNAAQTYGVNAGNNLIGAGNARAAGAIGGANAMASGISGGFNNFQSQQMMNRLMPPAQTGYGGDYDAWQTTGNGMPY